MTLRFAVLFIPDSELRIPNCLVSGYPVRSITRIVG